VPERSIGELFAPVESSGCVDRLLAMKRFALSLKAIGPFLVVAGTAQYIVCHLSPNNYSEKTNWLFIAGWGVGALAMSWFEKRAILVYLGSVALAAPGISYSMLGYGALEMGGWFHALVAGVWALPFYFLFRRIRGSRPAP